MAALYVWLKFIHAQDNPPPGLEGALHVGLEGALHVG
jgi:hypothetical protein